MSRIRMQNDHFDNMLKIVHLSRSSRTLVRVRNENLIFLFLNQNICCGYSKEPSQWDYSFEHTKHILKVMGKKVFTILR